MLKNILKQQNKLAAQTIDQTNTNQAPMTKPNAIENKMNPSSNNANNSQTKAEPAFLKRFNLKEQHKFIKKSEIEKEQTLSQKPEDKTQELKENEEDKGARKSFQEKVRSSMLYKSFRKVLEKKESPERKSKEEDKVGEDTKGSANKKARVDGDRLPKDSKDTKEKEKFFHKMMKGKKNKHETNISQKISENDADSKPVESIKIEEEKKNMKEETSDIKEKEEKAKLSTTMVNNKPSPPSIKDTKVEEMKQINPEKSEKVSESREPRPAKDPEIRQKPDDRETKKPETRKSVMEDKCIKIDLPSEAPNVCAQCVRRKSLNQESKQCLQIHVSEPHTTCVNPNFIRCTDINENCTVGNESRCTCYLPMSQSTNECINHPKSCLKKERQFRCPNSQETSASIPCYDKRNWAECGCRRVLCCEDCRRPRAECSCRSTYVPCANCCKPRSKCSCKSICKTRSTCGHMRSMFCLYCDNPRETCTCRAPLRKCSYCELSMDLCRCEERKTICDGRPVLTEADNDRTMYVTAWKPREEIRRYFSRNLDVLRTDSINECWCHEKLKHHNSDDLPYQRLSVFSDVMDELQQKLSESSCCTRCRKIPCCCNPNEGKIKCCVSPKTRRKLVAVCMEKPKVKSLGNYKCDTGKEKSDRPRKIIVSLCCECKSTPCRCKKSKSNQKKPRAKCYYCKSSPCICIATGECNKPRPCRCNDSPCRTKEKEKALRGKTSTKPKNNDEKIICVR
ncbi:uncharacterized protein LOC117603253 [Osmia lignaria lignaria]|uniref:uncharacterized protein LOC117603253 n=1 Tax=Osmia lignaria lignaria TaxID=1437193 RepID=UPI00402BDC62